jgi:hypothetical protein
MLSMTFFPGLGCFVAGLIVFRAVYFRRRHPDEEPTGFVALSEGLLTNRWGISKNKPPLPPWWFGLPASVVLMAFGILGIVVSFF